MEVLKRNNANRLDPRRNYHSNEPVQRRMHNNRSTIWSRLYGFVLFLFIIVGNNSTLQESSDGLPYSFHAEEVPYTPSSDPIGIQFSNHTIPNFGMNDTNSDECSFF